MSTAVPRRCTASSGSSERPTDADEVPRGTFGRLGHRSARPDVVHTAHWSGMTQPTADSSRPQRLLAVVAGGATAAALGAIPISRMPRAVRIGYVLAPAALATIVTYVAQRSNDPDTGDTSPTDSSTAMQIGLSLTFGGLIAGAGAAAICLDRAVETALRARNVPAPRLVIGLVSGVLTVALTAAEAGPTGLDIESPMPAA